MRLMLPCQGDAFDAPFPDGTKALSLIRSFEPDKGIIQGIPQGIPPVPEPTPSDRPCGLLSIYITCILDSLLPYEDYSPSFHSVHMYPDVTC